MTWVILWLLVGGGSGLLMNRIEKRYGPPQDWQSRKRIDRLNLVLGTALGPVATALLPVAYFQSAKNRKALYGPDGNEPLQYCLNLKQAIRAKIVEIESEMVKKQALLSSVQHLLEGNFSRDAAQRAGIRPDSAEMPSPEKVEETCQEWLRLKQRKEDLEAGLALTEERIAELRFGYEGLLEASDIPSAALALPEPVPEQPAETETDGPETAIATVDKGALRTAIESVEMDVSDLEEAYPPGDIVRIVSWRQVEQLIGLRVRIRRTSKYAHQNRGIGTIRCAGTNRGWVRVKFDDGYDDVYRIGLTSTGLCDLELAEPTADGRPLYDQMWQDLLGQPDRAILQRLIDEAKTYLLDLPFAKCRVATVFYLLDRLKVAKTKKFLEKRGSIAGWFAREFGDVKLSMALSGCAGPKDAVDLISFRLEQAARVLSEPEPPTENKAEMPTESEAEPPEAEDEDEPPEAEAEAGPDAPDAPPESNLTPPDSSSP